MTNITYDINKDTTMTNFNLQPAHEAACIASATRAASAVACAATKVSPRQSLLVTCEKFIARKLAAFNKRRLQLIIHTLNRPH